MNSSSNISYASILFFFLFEQVTNPNRMDFVLILFYGCVFVLFTCVLFQYITTTKVQKEIVYH